MSDVVFLVGAPGTGKTTLMRALLPEVRTLIASPKWTVTKDIVAAGHYTGDTFDGADRVPYNGVMTALEFWWQQLAGKAKLTFFDGDRFSFNGVLDWMKEHNVRARVIHLTASAETLKARYEARGSNQNAIWIKGRVSKARKFAEQRSDTLWLESSVPTSTLADHVRRWPEITWPL